MGTSFGLTVSALVSAVRDELPLYQAIIVTDLVWLANWAIFMALATYNRHPRGSHAVQYTAIGQTYFSIACILYLWARAKELDNGFVEKAGGGGTVFVVLFMSTSATGAGRTAALVVISILLAGYTVVAAVFLSRRVQSSIRLENAKKGIQLPLKRRHSAASTVPALRSPTPPPATPISPLPSSPSTPHTPKLPNGTTPATNPMRLPPSLSLDPHLIILGLFILVPYVISVGDTELQIQRNAPCHDDDESTWGFGQILALTVTIVPVVVTIQAFRKYGWKQRPRVAQEKAGRGHRHSRSHSHGNGHAAAASLSSSGSRVFSASGR
ncbi:hypothetical protein R3P38DRAFT_1461126 [Favolaschia claudopus]|uniref:Uncharacterized protein n=1 Tax=Favolaschia claudopus TaxID=2862362 RepID=A0AAW0DR12_9AGAR